LKYLIKEDKPIILKDITDETGLEFGETKVILAWLLGLGIVKIVKRNNRKMYVITTRFPNKVNRYIKKGIEYDNPKEEEELMEVAYGLSE
jgi:ATP phosphoribosyltransferase